MKPNKLYTLFDVKKEIRAQGRQFTSGKCLFIALRAIAMIFTFTLFVTAASAGTLRVLHTFVGTDGASPLGVVFGPDGKLYGVAVLGGSAGIGTAFQLTPVDGHWTTKILLDFGNGGAQGIYPNGGLILDSAGNLYGTTELIGGGTGGVFELSPTADGPWTETILYALASSEGLYPQAGLVFDSAGNLYTATTDDGANGDGTAFELTLIGGVWTETRIHYFDGTDGSSLKSTPILDARGNLYGTAFSGGGFGFGTVWELTSRMGGGSSEKTLYSFTGAGDGAGPNMPSGLARDSSGNLYGTTQSGGAHGDGTVFELSPRAGGTWSLTVLHSFNGGDGSGAQSGLIFDAAGNLYGETFSGGADNDGVVFKLTPPPTRSGAWTETVLYSFHGTDGNGPQFGLVLDTAGHLYGTTYYGGASNDGIVFEITP